MRMASRLCIAAFVVLITAVASHAAETLKPGDVISGRLRLVQTKHPNGTPIRAYQIVSDAPKMFEQKDDFCGDAAPKTFHLAGERNKTLIAKLKRLTGKNVAVIAEDFFCSQTAWHIGDAVVIKWRFADKAARQRIADQLAMAGFFRSSLLKCPLLCSQASSTRLGNPASAQITKNHTHPVCSAMNPAPDDK